MSIVATVAGFGGIGEVDGWVGDGDIVCEICSPIV